MNQEQVHVLAVQQLQLFSEASLHISFFITPDLGYDEQVFSSDESIGDGLSDGLADFIDVAVHGCGVDEAVAHFDGWVDEGGVFDGPGAVADFGHFGAVVEGERVVGFHKN